MESRLWSIVLAANAGQPLSHRHEDAPEQFWWPPGTASLVRPTLARLAPLCPAGRTVVVLNESQREHVRGLPGAPTARMVFQPDDRGTAAAMLFGLLPVLTTDPAAMVLVTPSNQAVGNADAFQQGIGDAVSYARRCFGVVLFGAEATSARSTYRWVSVGSAQRIGAIRPVVSSIETSSKEAARQLMSAGAVWNTLAIVAPARALLHLCRQRLPVMSSVFVAALTMPSETQGTFLAAQYPQLPSRDLAQHVLTASSNLAADTWPQSVAGRISGPPSSLGWMQRVPS